MYNAFIISLLILNSIHAQNTSKLYGSWVKTKMVATNTKFTKEIEERDKQYFKYVFNSNGFLYKNLKYNEFGHMLKYSIKDNIIDLGFQQLGIENLTDSTLILIELDNGNISPNAAKIYLTKEGFLQKTISIKSNDYFVDNSDTVYFESPKLYPIYNNNINPDVKSVLQTAVEGLSEKKESFAYATFILETNGKIQNLVIHHPINKNYDKALKKAILKTEGFWYSPILKGKKVRVLKEISFAYITFPDIEQKGEYISFNHTNNIYPETYRNLFIASIKQLYLGNYSESIDILSKCKNLTPNPLPLYYQMAVCYKLLNDVKNLDLHIAKIKNSNFDYLIKYVEKK